MEGLTGGFAWDRVGEGDILALPAIFLLVAIATQVLICYGSIRNLHIVMGEGMVLGVIWAYGWYAGDPAGTTAAWTAALMVACAIALRKRHHHLAPLLLFLMAGSLAVTSRSMDGYALGPGVLMILVLGSLARSCTGPYFLHRLQSSFNEIGVVLRRYGILDQYNVSLLLSLSLSLIILGSSPAAWILYPLAAWLHLAAGLHLGRGRLALPLLLLLSGGMLIYLGSLLLLTYITVFPVVIILLVRGGQDPGGTYGAPGPWGPSPRSIRSGDFRASDQATPPAPSMSTPSMSTSAPPDPLASAPLMSVPSISLPSVPSHHPTSIIPRHPSAPFRGSTPSRPPTAHVPGTDQYLQMILLLTVGLAAGVAGLKDPWMTGVLSLDLPVRVAGVYLAYLVALGCFLGCARRFPSLLFTGLMALAELAVLLMVTFRYPFGIPFFFGIMLMLMGYFGIHLCGHLPGTRQRTWPRDRMILLAVTTGLYYLPIILFNYRNDIPELSSWGYGLTGAVVLLISDIMDNGLRPLSPEGRAPQGVQPLHPGDGWPPLPRPPPNRHPGEAFSQIGQRGTWPHRRWGIRDRFGDLHPGSRPAGQAPPAYGLTGTELFLLLLPALLCMNFSRDISLWICLVGYLAVLATILLRGTGWRLTEICLAGILFHLPFNLLLYAGRVSDPRLHLLSDIPPVFLMVLYTLHHLTGMFPPYPHPGVPGTGAIPADRGGYRWSISFALLVLGTFGSSHAGMAAVPVIMFLLCCRKRDMLTTPAAHVLLMFVLYLSLSVSRGLHDRAMTMLIVMSLVPMIMGLVSELVFREQPMAFSFFTLSFLLMFGVPWFAAGGGSFHAAVVTTVVWTVFGGICFSAGFSLDRRYLRLMGILFLMAALLVTTYSTAILGWETVIFSLMTFGAIAIIAAYFYYLRDPGERGRGRSVRGWRER